MYIFRWVVSSELDMRALEQLSLVCRGFYISARWVAGLQSSSFCSTGSEIFIFLYYLFFCIFLRDPEIWRSACLRVWGRNCTKVVPFKSWREMFLQRPRVRFDGNDALFQLQFYFVEMSEYLRDIFKKLRNISVFLFFKSCPWVFKKGLHFREK